MNFIKSLFGANKIATSPSLTPEQLKQAVGELFYHANAFDLGQFGPTAGYEMMSVKGSRARIFLAGFEEAMKHVESTEAVLDIAGKVHDAMVAAWREVRTNQEIHSAMEREFEYRVGAYSGLTEKAARAEPIFILLAIRELAKATTDDVSAGSVADRADALMLAAYKAME